MRNKKLALVFGIMLMTLVKKASAQDVELFVIQPFPLEITYNKTVNLIFPYAIKSVDKGSRDILAQKARGVENILQVKSASHDFDQTNLTVITGDGKLYSFVVDYAAEPVQLNIELIKGVVESKAADVVLDREPNEKFLEGTSQSVSADPKRLRRISDSCDKIRFSLSGLYVKNDVLFYRFSINNRSNVSYDIESLRFFISDKKRVKRGATQQTELTPLHVHAAKEKIQGNQSHQFVFALPKFTIPDARKLTIQLMEKSGGRHLQLQLENRRIIKARPIN